MPTPTATTTSTPTNEMEGNQQARPTTTQGHARSNSSSAHGSPIPTPSGPRSPHLGNSHTQLSSSPSSNGFTGAPSSPSLSQTNRFGLSLGNLVRRPRGWTTSSAQRSPGATSPNAGGSDQPPSPNGGERTTGYGFPALRRSLSKRATSSGGGGGGGASGTPTGEASSSRTRQRRSSSQPPNSNFGVDSTENNAESRPATSSGDAPQQPPAVSVTATPSSTGADSSEVQKLRLVPHLESSRSLHFEPIERDLAAFAIVKVGRFTDRSNHHQAQNGSSPADPARVAFKSKVVSRGHAEIWADSTGKFFIKDTKSSSGTFLNHIRLSAPNTESRPFPLKDGDVLQLGVDYQGGTEEIYRCVKMRVELNRAWQRGANSFNTAALAQLRALGGGSSMEPTPTSATAMTAAASNASAVPKPIDPPTAAQQAAAAASITDCCICLYPVTVCQALFIAPCSHVTHFKCIRPLVEQNYPGFCCPLCRTYADLEADVEIDLPEVPVDSEPVDSPVAHTPDEVSQPPSMAPVEETEEPASRAGSIRSGRPGNSRRSSGVAIAGPDGLPPGIAISLHRGRSRPSSRAPSIAEVASPNDDNNSNDDEDEEQEVAPSETPERASGLSTSRPLPMPISNSHLAATTSADLYASLANAATPPNNMFLSTLADSPALRLAGMNSSPHHASTHSIPTSGGPTNGTPVPMSLDAAMERVERPIDASSEGAATTGDVGRTSAEASRSGSGSGGEETERDVEEEVGEVEGEVDDAETEQGGPGSSRENVAGSMGEGGVSTGSTTVKSNGKGKEIEVRSTEVSNVQEGVKKMSFSEPTEGEDAHLST